MDLSAKLTLHFVPCLRKTSGLFRQTPPVKSAPASESAQVRNGWD